MVDEAGASCYESNMAPASKGRGQQRLFDKHGRANWQDGKRVRHKRRRKP